VHQDTLTADKRATARVSLSVPGLIRLAAGDVRVTVRNISHEGAMIEGVSDVEIGLHVAVHIRGVGWVDARVAWVIAPRCGLAFDSEIDPQAVSAKP
jgi:hypothetical protein